MGDVDLDPHEYRSERRKRREPIISPGGLWRLALVVGVFVAVGLFARWFHTLPLTVMVFGGGAAIAALLLLAWLIDRRR
jgi:hypothetical protein